MNRRDFLQCTAASVSALAIGQVANAASKPNIVLIMTDDLGYGHLGCYGQQHIVTPHLDRLASKGIRFTQAYAGAPLCAPSRSVLFTGFHSGHTPVRANEGGIPLRDEDVTIAEILRNAGYATALFGKWGLGDAATTGEPNQQGFDEFFGYLHQRHAHFYYTDYLWHNGERHLLPGNMDGKREQYTHDVVVEKGLEYLRAKHDKPFFCCFSFTIPHHEWTVPADSLAQYAGKFEEEPQRLRWREGYALPKQPKANMAAMISHMDRSVGQILDTLSESGLRENTLVLFVSDNGADSYSLACPEFFKANGSLRGYKGNMYEGGIRIPAIASWPETIPAGQTSDFIWDFCDLLPTFAELAGASSELPKNLDGVSIVPALTGRGNPVTREYFYWELPTGAKALRMGQWKAVVPKRDAPVELYNLDSDPSEQHNIASQQEAIVATCTAIMARNHTDPPPQIEPTAPDGRQYR